jgi:uncharacterized membrane protein
VLIAAVCLLVTAAMVALDQPILLILVALAGAAMFMATKQDTARPHTGWPLILAAVLVIGGTGISIYMTRHHEVEIYGGEEYQGETLVGCAEAQGVSCDIVNTSPWSEVFSVPLFTWAIPTYLLLLVLAGLAMSGRHRSKSVIFIAGVGATAFSVFLFYISKVELGAVCLWCMRLYAINGVLPALAVASGLTKDDTPDGRTLGTSTGVFVVLTALAVFAQTSYRAQLLSGTPEIAEIAEIDAAAAQVVTRDPEGPAPERSITITTEDSNEAELKIRPGDAWKGNPDAKVTIIEFADFECGYCKRAGF